MIGATCLINDVLKGSRDGHFQHIETFVILKVSWNEKLYKFSNISSQLIYSQLETVKESWINWNFHFDLQLHPTVLNGTYLYVHICNYIPPIYNNTLHSWTPKIIMGCIFKRISWLHELSQLIHYYLYPSSRSGSGRCIVNSKKEFRLVRLAFGNSCYSNFEQSSNSRSTSQGITSQLGIFIARQDQPDIGCHGYFVAHIVPDGLVKR